MTSSQHVYPMYTVEYTLGLRDENIGRALAGVFDSYRDALAFAKNYSEYETVIRQITRIPLDID